ncbi:MAG: hypothetical protein LBW85_13900 [Deltaproteobacteria bacterium]|nr:hypothetical protein [Deltaproteobacteria bacterium]
MTADDSRRLVTFTGRVVARQADLIISCDVMRVNYQPHGSYGAPSGAAGDQAAPSAGQDPQVPALPPPAEPPGSDAGAAVPPGAPSAADLGAAGSAPGPEAEPSAAAETGGPSAEPAATGDSQDSGRRSPLQGGQEIDKVECEGAVKIQQGDRMAVAKRALYLAKAQPRRLVLTGEARVWQGPNSITGHQITYYLDENRSLVDSQGSRRVRAFYDQRGTPR